MASRRSCGTGPSLVKGRRHHAVGHRAQDKPGGSAREIEIAGGVKANGAGVSPIEQHGAIDSLRMSGGFIAAGRGFDTI